MATEKRPTLYCSFCGKAQYEVKLLIAGPLVFICDECMTLCLEICLNEGILELESKTGQKLDLSPLAAKEAEPPD